MKTLLQKLSVLLVFMVLGSCGPAKSQSNGVEIWEVSDVQQDCVGEMQTRCLLYRVKGQSEWQWLYESIEGFEPKQGFAYELEVQSRERKMPMADQSSVGYKLVKVLNETEVTHWQGLLNNGWALVALNGEPLKSDDRPFVEILLSKNRISGSAGCNRFFGEWRLLHSGLQAIAINDLASTEMYCEGKMETEAAILEALRKVNRFEIHQAELHLYHNQNRLLTGRRID